MHLSVAASVGRTDQPAARFAYLDRRQPRPRRPASARIHATQHLLRRRPSHRSRRPCSDDLADARRAPPRRDRRSCALLASDLERVSQCIGGRRDRRVAGDDVGEAVASARLVELVPQPRRSAPIARRDRGGRCPPGFVRGSRVLRVRWAAEPAPDSSARACASRMARAASVEGPKTRCGTPRRVCASSCIRSGPLPTPAGCFALVRQASSFASRDVRVLRRSLGHLCSSDWTRGAGGNPTPAPFRTHRERRQTTIRGHTVRGARDP